MEKPPTNEVCLYSPGTLQSVGASQIMQYPGNLPGQVAAAMGRGTCRGIVTSKGSVRHTCVGSTGTLMGTADACQAKG